MYSAADVLIQRRKLRIGYGIRRYTPELFELTAVARTESRLHRVCESLGGPSISSDCSSLAGALSIRFSLVPLECFCSVVAVVSQDRWSGAKGNEMQVWQPYVRPNDYAAATTLEQIELVLARVEVEERLRRLEEDCADRRIRRGIAAASLVICGLVLVLGLCLAVAGHPVGGLVGIASGIASSALSWSIGSRGVRVQVPGRNGRVCSVVMERGAAARGCGAGRVGGRRARAGAVVGAV